MSEHTKGRIRLGLDCAIHGGGFQWTHMLGMYAEREANARRLVACWNACEGISTENVEGIGELGGYRNSHISEFLCRPDWSDQLKVANDRAELLKALELCTRNLEHAHEMLTGKRRKEKLEIEAIADRVAQHRATIAKHTPKVTA